MIDNYNSIMDEWSAPSVGCGTDTVDNYSDTMDEWTAPPVGCCTNMVEIEPDCDMRKWAIQHTITVLANADYYYTKDEVDSLLEQVTKDKVTREEVERMIQRAIADKADKADLDALAQQVSANTVAILNTYTKQETNALLEGFLTKLRANEMFANYSKVEDTTLILNAEDISI